MKEGEEGMARGGRKRREAGAHSVRRYKKKTLKELRWRLGVGKERSRNC